MADSTTSPNKLKTKKILSPDESSIFNLKGLEDSLLIEILCRLPSAKFAARCKLVAKRWNYLISSPYFVRQFVTHHSYHDNYQTQIIITVTESCLPEPDHIFNSFCFIFDPPFESKPPLDFRFNFPHRHKDFMHSRVVASYNDLLLIQLALKPFHAVKNYYIYNPITTQVLAFSLPANASQEDNTTNVGFICEPFYSIRGDQYIINPKFKSRVVLFHEFTEDMTVSTYSVETGEWNFSVLDSNYRIQSNIIAYKGKLHWFNGSNIVAYDPFDVDQSYFIRGPEGLEEMSNHFIGVCNGFLRMMAMHLSIEDDIEASSFRIWELKDYKTGTWSLEHNILFGTMISDGIQITELDQWDHSTLGLGFHPSDEHTVYLAFGNVEVSCNLNQQVRKVHEIHTYKRTNRRTFFQLVAPLWPTPL